METTTKRAKIIPLEHVTQPMDVSRVVDDRTGLPLAIAPHLDEEPSSGICDEDCAEDCSGLKGFSPWSLLPGTSITVTYECVCFNGTACGGTSTVRDPRQPVQPVTGGEDEKLDCLCAYASDPCNAWMPVRHSIRDGKLTTHAIPLKEHPIGPFLGVTPEGCAE